MKTQTCIGCKKKKRIAGRGLCPACHQAARREIAADRETWESLEKKKLAAPLARKGEFAKALERAK
jgi:hypothetical protein